MKYMNAWKSYINPLKSWIKRAWKFAPEFDFESSAGYIQNVKMEAHPNKLLNVFNNRLVHHILFWLFFFAFLFISPTLERIPFFKLLVHNLGHIAILIPPVYSHFYILDKFFFNRCYGIYFVLLFVTICVSGIAANFFFMEYFAYKGGLSGSISFIFFSLVLSTVAKLFKKAIQQRLKLQAIESKQLQTELDLLKVQINPHFLFNTLNNLFGMARNQDPATAEGISRLSHLMRYIIHDSKVDLIDLDKEIEQIRRLIELQKLRFSDEDDIDIDFLIVGENKKVRIPPMLLIPFVENAFKHGIRLDSASHVRIVVKAQDTHLEFSVNNSLHDSPGEYGESESGLGLNNVRRRLELLFPGSHELKIQTYDKSFDIRLVIEI